jgi:hypothetical protein
MDPNKRDDFLFALFIAQEPDPQLLSNEAGSSSAVVWKSNHPVIFPKRIGSYTPLLCKMAFTLRVFQ